MENGPFLDDLWRFRNKKRVIFESYVKQPKAKPIKSTTGIFMDFPIFFFGTAYTQSNFLASNTSMGW